MEDNKGTAEVVDRKEGYYWVMGLGEWMIGEYVVNGIDKGWYVNGFNEYYPDSAFEEIDERQICRS